MLEPMEEKVKKKKQFFNLKWADVTSIAELIDNANQGATAIRLELDDNNLLGLGSDDVEKLTDTVDSMKYVKALCFINCEMTVNDLKILFDVLVQLPELEFLDLTNNPLEEEGCKLVADLLARNTTMKHLDLSRCSISSKGISHIIERLEANHTLRSLILNENQELTSSNIVMLFDTIKVMKNIVLFSVLNTYCNAKYMSDIFKVLKKHQNILYLGFPTFFQKKKGFMESLDDSQESLNVIDKEDLLKFRDVMVQKSLLENLKRNFSLVKVFNQHVRNDVRALLRRNLDLMKNIFSDILQNGDAKNTEFSRQSIVVIGRKKSGKSELIASLFGKSKHRLHYDYELEIRRHVVAIYKDENLKSRITHPSEDEKHDFSYHIASRMLSKRSQNNRANEKLMQARGVGSQRRHTPRSKKRQQLSFYNYPKNQGNSRPVVESLRESRSQTGNALLHSYRSRRDKRRPRGKRQSNRSRYNLDGNQGQNRNKDASELVGIAESEEKEEGEQKQTKGETGENFDPKTLAMYGNPKEKPKVYVEITEISTRVSNSVQQGGGDKGTLHSLTSRVLRGDTKRKLTEAEKFGGINKALVDLVHLCFNLRSDQGVLLITFALPKILKYIRVKEEQMILNNPIVEFLKENVRCAFSKSRNLQVFLVATGYDEQYTTDELNAVNIMLQQSIWSKDLKRIVRFKIMETEEHICYFPVNYETNTNIEKLRGDITKRLYKLAKLNATKRQTKLPMKFIRAFDLLREENVRFASRQDILGLVGECNIIENEMDAFLKFLKQARLILYFPEIDMLSDFIVMNRIFFYKMMYQFVNRRYLTKVLQNKDIKQMLKNEGHQRDLSLFKKKMILSGDMIQFVWKHNPNLLVEEDKVLSTSCYLYLIEMMKKSLFITPWRNMRFNLSSLSGLATPIMSTNVDDFIADNLFLIASCMKRTPETASKSAKLKNIRSFAGSMLKRNRARSTLTTDSRELTVSNNFEKEKPKKGRKGYDRPRGGGSFEGAVFSSRAKKGEEDFRNLLLDDGTVIPEDDLELSFHGKQVKRGRTKKELSLRRSSRRKSGRRRSNKRILAIESKKGMLQSEASSPDLGFQSTLDRQGNKNKRVSFRPRYLLNKNKPVSIILDFKSTYLPTGLFCRLASALYDQVLDAVKHEKRGFMKSIEGVEVHQNLFKIKFDRLMNKTDDTFSEASSQGGESICGSEVENRSLSGAKQLGEAYSNKEDKEYVALVKEPNKDSIIMIVRDHDMAPKYLTLLDSALKIVLPQAEPEEQGVINEYTTMFYHVVLTKKMVKVEVKNKKFITLESAERRQFAPWFSKNKRISSMGRV